MGNRRTTLTLLFAILTSLRSAAGAPPSEALAPMESTRADATKIINTLFMETPLFKRRHKQVNGQQHG